MSSTTPQTPQVIVLDLLEVTVPNWKKFNPRADRVNFSWFRMENRFFEDQAIFYLSPEQKLLYLFILCQASKGNRETLKIRISYASAILSHSQESVRNDFFLIAELGLIIIKELDTPHANLGARGVKKYSQHQNDTGLPSNSRPTLRDVTLRDDINHVPSVTAPKVTVLSAPVLLDFESIYSTYPKRKGSQRKGEAIKLCERKFKDQTQYDLLNKAVVNYADFCEREKKSGTEWVSMFKTFVGSLWEEWVNPVVFSNGKSHDEEWEKIFGTKPPSSEEGARHG